MAYMRTSFIIAAQCMWSASAGSIKHIPLERVQNVRSQEEFREFATGFLGGSRGLNIVKATRATNLAATPAYDFDKPMLFEKHSETTRKVHSYYDVVYYLHVGIGTPLQGHLHLIMDTGSSDLWVLPESYSRKNSSTAGALVGSVSLQYGMGNTTGEEVTDTVCTGTLCVQDATVISDTRVTGIALVKAGTIDGLVGLAFGALSSTWGATFLDSVLKQDFPESLAFYISLAEKSAIFGAVDDIITDLSSNAEARGDGVMLGLLEMSTLGLGESEPYFWMVQMEVAINGVELTTLDKSLTTKQGGSFKKKVPAILDTGTTLTMIPKTEYDAVISHLFQEYDNDGPTSCAYAEDKVTMLCDCDTKLTPMTLTFTASDKTATDVTITLGSKELLQLVGYNDDEETQPICRLGLMGQEGAQWWILGDTFLRSADIVYVYKSAEYTAPYVVMYPRKKQGEEFADEQQEQNALQSLPLVVVTGLASMSIVMSSLIGRYYYRQTAARHRSLCTDKVTDVYVPL